MGISSEVQIYNLALNAVGERSNISLPTETSRRAEVCRLWYSPIVEQVLSAAAWPEATKIAYLAETAERDDDDAWLETEPAPGYSYAYNLPSDCVRPQYLADFSQFLITYFGDNQRVLHTNTYQAVLAYTANITNISIWNAELRMAIVYGLAANICMPLTGKPSRAKMLADKANELILGARMSAANASNQQQESIPDWIAGRGGNVSPSTRFFYPLGGLLQSSVAA